MTGNLARLQDLQDDIHGAYGAWGTNELADGCARAAAVSSFGGNPAALRQIAADYQSAYAAARAAYQALYPLQERGISGVWAGETKVSATDALTAVTDDVLRGAEAIRVLAATIEAHSLTVQSLSGQDTGGISTLAEVAAQAREMTMLGSMPSLTGYDGDQMRQIHAAAMSAIDDRVESNIAMRNAAEDFTSRVHELQSQARAGRLGSSPLSALDEVVIADAGQDMATGHEAVLTAAMDDRAAAALAGMNDTDRRRITGLLAAAASPEQRAYLMKALAAGYSVAEVDRFNTMIAAHGADPAWLDQHLSPLAMDGPETPVKQTNAFGNAVWTQGQHPTCVASATVAARAEIDPLYALQLTTGGRPGDPAFDSPAAFADRLRDEQQGVYDGARHWYENFWNDGMTQDQSTQIADEQLATHTGAKYENVDLNDRQSRADIMPSVERAVDEGYPVPLSVNEGDRGHGMMIIGHSGDQLQIHNPWGYTFWVSEADFINGDINAADSDMPKHPNSVRLPEGAK